VNAVTLLYFDETKEKNILKMVHQHSFFLPSSKSLFVFLGNAFQ